jgi:hypothetical protein
MIVYKDEDVNAGDGPLTFASPTLHEMLGADRTVDAIKRLYGRDPYVTRTASAVLDAAGWNGDDILADEDSDPTTP